MPTIDTLTPVLAGAISGTDLTYVGLPTDPDPDRSATVNQMKDVYLGDNAVTNAKLRDSASLSVIGRSANSAGDPADIAAGLDGYVLRRSGTTLGFGQVTATGLATDAVSTTKIGDLQVTNAKIAAGVDASKLTTGTLPIARIADSALTPAKTSFFNSNGSLAGIYAGVAPGASGVGVRMPTGWVMSQVGSPATIVRITHNLGTLGYAPMVTIQEGPISLSTVYVDVKDANYFDVIAKDVATETRGLVDFSFIVVRF